jgi:hypothetical protein
MKYGIVVIAASAGGVMAVRDLLSGLPATFRVPVLIARHRETTPNILEGIFRRCTPLLFPAQSEAGMRHPKTDLGFVNAQPRRRKNTTSKTTITSVTNPPPMYMMSLLCRDWPRSPLGRCGCCAT